MQYYYFFPEIIAVDCPPSTIHTEHIHYLKIYDDDSHVLSLPELVLGHHNIQIRIRAALDKHVKRLPLFHPVVH